MCVLLLLVSLFFATPAALASSLEAGGL